MQEAIHVPARPFPRGPARGAARADPRAPAGHPGHGRAGTLDANPVPFLLDAGASLLGTLRAHVARANAVWRELERSREVLVVFQAVDSYVTPSWYASKREHGKVVPTWNYALVQAWGRPRTIEDAAWLGAQIRALTRAHETARAEPWAVEDAPEPFVATQIKAIVGIEIEITRIEGKWKASQNRPPADRAGRRGRPGAPGRRAFAAMAELVRERAQPSIASSAAKPSR